MTHPTAAALNLCIAGMGGYARSHHELAFDLEAAGQLRLLATCDPQRHALRHVGEAYAFSRRGVEVLAGFDEMLERHGKRAHFVTIATPIHLHAAMHRAVLSRNLGCYLEKPPTLDPGELEAMISAEQASDFQTEVGFNYIAESWRHEFKRRLLDGEWGALRALSFYGAWNRKANYYRRSPWAGRLACDGRLVLDSAFGNAAAHHIHNLLFFAGREGLFSWAAPREVRAEMYRAYGIEGVDTVFSTMTTVDGIALRTAVTHACQTRSDLRETLHCERAEIHIRPYQSVEIVHRSGKREYWQTPTQIKLLEENVRHYLNYLRGDAERPLTRLADCRPFVIWNALNYVASQRIGSIPAHSSFDGEIEANGCYILGIEEIMSRFIESGEFPSAQGVAWSHPGAVATPAEVPRLHSRIARMIEQAHEESRFAASEPRLGTPLAAG